MTAISARDDAVVVEDDLDLARRGDHDAFAALVQRHDRGLRALAYRLLGDRERMDDALQEAYLRAYRALPRFRSEATFRTWLYRIAYNASLEELERTQRPHVVSLEDAGELPGRDVDVAESVSLRDGLAAGLAALAPEDRAAVLLVDAQGFDYRAAGEVLGVPEGTIASRLNRARAALRRSLGGSLGETPKGDSGR
jgi:RNA polymerase sigma-70 factor, ECF subfamily